MAIAVSINNTFLDVPEHRFLSFDEPVACQRRSGSVPRSWKPVSVLEKKRRIGRSDTICSSCSTGSDISSCSEVESFEDSPTTTDGDSPCMYFPTPTSSQGSPRKLFGSVADTCSPCHVAADGAEGNSECGRGRWCEGQFCMGLCCAVLSDFVNAAAGDGAKSNAESESAASHSDDQTSFATQPEDPQINPVISSIHSALLSCGHVYEVKIEKGNNGASSTLISAVLDGGMASSARSYEALQLAKKALEAVATQIGSLSLLSARVQKEERGYSLRSSIACIPDEFQDKLCWDVSRRGHCPRRSTCRWYHPQDADIRRVKVSIKCSEQAIEAVHEAKSSSIEKHKISLDELVL